MEREMRPCRGRVVAQEHVLLWVETEETKGRLRPLWRRAWSVATKGDRWSFGSAVAYDDPADLAAFIGRLPAAKQPLMIWLKGGWEDFVLSGLAELVDNGAINWSYCSLDDSKVSLTGACGQRQVQVTSVGHWIGGQWLNWRAAAQSHQGDAVVSVCDSSLPAEARPLSAGEGQLLATHAIICDFVYTLQLGRIDTTMPRAALRAWCRFLGPRVALPPKPKKRGRVIEPAAPHVIVAPSPYRSKRAASLERHVCSGLVWRQLVSGHVDTGVDIVDLSAAYLRGLTRELLPARWLKSLSRPSVAELVQVMNDRGAMALVLLETEGVPFLRRAHSKWQLCTGRYWTWLTGVELKAALALGAVQRCERAEVWQLAGLPPELSSAAQDMAGLFAQGGLHYHARLWRSLYSILVGRTAAWRRVWTDAAFPGIMPRWAAWSHLPIAGGTPERWRSIAGRTQRLTVEGNAGQTAPILFGCITAYVRISIWACVSQVRLENVYAITADALWVRRGLGDTLCADMGRLLDAPDCLRLKRSYDEAWMDGKSSAVLRAGDQYVLHQPGVLDGSLLGDSGKTETWASLPWSETESLDPAQTFRRTPRRHSGRRIIDAAPARLERLPFADEVHDELLDVSLLRPIVPGRAVKQRD